jgi:ribosomal protein L29
MKKTDLSKYSIEDLKKEVAKLRETLREFRFGSAGSRSRDTRAGRNTRKSIARYLTELSARAKVAKTGKKS